MRNTRRTCRWIGATLLLLTGFAPLLIAAPKTLNVSIRQAELRSTPSPFGAILGTAAYGDRVEVIEENGAWIKVTATPARLTGWMHTSALTKQTIKLQAGKTTTGTGASSGEVALAGKGFSRELESAYKNKNRNVDFTWVDRMEKYKSSPEQMQTFLQDGELKLREGGAK